MKIDGFLPFRTCFDQAAGNVTSDFQGLLDRAPLSDESWHILGRGQILPFWQPLDMNADDLFHAYLTGRISNG